MSNGKIYLVGSGPGDIELITLKGYKLITRADVILHDHLIPLELLQLAGARGIHTNYVSQLLSAASYHGAQGASSSPLVDPLSERELEILRLIALGCSNPEIAEELVLAIGTVKSHTGNIYSKLGVRNRTEAVACARELDLL